MPPNPLSKRVALNCYALHGASCHANAGAYAGFLKFLGFWIYMREAACREQRSCEPLLGGFGGMPPKKIFKNGAISCVLRVIFNHFHGKTSSEKIINKHEFFH